MINRKVLALHWGFSIGGIAQYTAIIDGVSQFAPVTMRNLVVLKPGANVDEKTLGSLDAVGTLEYNGLAKTLAAIREQIVLVSPDLLMTHGFNAHLITYLLGAVYGVRVPVICSYHGHIHASTPLRRLLARPLEAFTHYYLRSRARSVVAVASHCKRFLTTKGVNEEKIRVIHNGVGDIANGYVTARPELRETWGVADEDILYGVVSRLAPVKGLPFLLDAFFRLGKEEPNARLVLIGSGSLESDLRAKVSAASFGDRVIFAGFRSDIVDCLSAIDVFMLPSLAEAHSIGLLEAMRAGRAIICTNVGGNMESVRNEEEALLVKAADADGLYHRMSRLHGDAGLRSELGAAARRRYVKDFTVDVTAKRTAQWFVSSLQDCSTPEDVV